MRTDSTVGNQESAKLKFVLAAIEDMDEYGVTQLSMRRVAERCGMSPGAPYRHFKDRNELGLEVFRYISDRWNCVVADTVAASGNDLKECLVDISTAYIRFLCDNPDFQTIITITDRSATPEQKKEKARMSATVRELIESYCDSVGMSEEAKARKTFAVRAFIYAGALLVNSGEMTYNEKNISMMRACIAREFDLP